jgi:hypothetical protein
MYDDHIDILSDDDDSKDPLLDPLPIFRHHTYAKLSKCQCIFGTISIIFLTTLMICIYFVVFPFMATKCVLKFDKVECGVHYNKYVNLYIITYNKHSLTSTDNIYHDKNTTSCYFNRGGSKVIEPAIRDINNKLKELQLDLFDVIFDSCRDSSYLAVIFGLIGVFVMISVCLLFCLMKAYYKSQTTF